MEGERLCPADASTESIEHLFALCDELDKKRGLGGFHNLRV